MSTQMPLKRRRTLSPTRVHTPRFLPVHQFPTTHISHPHPRAVVSKSAPRDYFDRKKMCSTIAACVFFAPACELRRYPVTNGTCLHTAHRPTYLHTAFRFVCTQIERARAVVDTRRRTSIQTPTALDAHASRVKMPCSVVARADTTWRSLIESRCRSSTSSSNRRRVAIALRCRFTHRV